jgi:hypothetical protein
MGGVKLIKRMLECVGISVLISLVYCYRTLLIKVILITLTVI